METVARPLNFRLPWASLALLFEILEQPEPVLSGAALADFETAAGEPLVSAGLLTPDGHEAADSSREHDDEPVRLTSSAEGQGLGYFNQSRGWVTVEADRLVRYRVDMEAFAGALLAQFTGGAAGARSWSADYLWNLGDIRLPGRARRVPVLLVRRLTDPAVWRTVRKILLARPSNLRVLLSAADAGDHPADIPTGHILVSLHDVVADDGTSSIDPAALAARMDGRAIDSLDEPLVVIGDGREVRLYDKVFRFPKGEKQRRIVRLLHNRYLAGQRRVSSAEIIAELDLPSGARLRDYFKKSNPPAWGRLLIEKDGMCSFCLRR